MDSINLAPAEWKIMNALWTDAPKTIIQLTRELESDTGWSKSTVISFLNRLVAKGAVYFEDGTRARQYYPAIEHDSLAAQESDSFLKRVYGGSLGLMVNNLVEHDALPREEIDRLRTLLDTLDNEGNRL